MKYSGTNVVAKATIGQEMVRVFLKVRKKSGNFTLSQRKVKCLKEDREK